MNNNKKRILLASFLSHVSEETIDKEVHFLVDQMPLSSPYIFLFRRRDDEEKYILTYNVSSLDKSLLHPRLYTTRIHRKKHTNTLYTINALNAAVAIQHEGKTGKNLRLDWEPYKDCLLLTAGKKLNSHPLEVVKIFKIEDPPEEN
tara:strand:+ start:3897 stop:4334 length:438 start_codon:yes stop_codon:yes gene_type:complete